MGNEADYFFLFFCRKWADDVGNTVSSCSQRIVFFSKKLRNGTNVIAVLRAIESPHIGKNQPFPFGFQKLFKNRSSKFCNNGVVILAENLNDGFNHHMVVEKAQRRFSHD